MHLEPSEELQWVLPPGRQPQPDTTPFGQVLQWLPGPPHSHWPGRAPHSAWTNCLISQSAGNLHCQVPASQPSWYAKGRAPFGYQLWRRDIHFQQQWSPCLSGLLCRDPTCLFTCAQSAFLTARLNQLPFLSLLPECADGKPAHHKTSLPFQPPK